MLVSRETIPSSSKDVWYFPCHRIYWVCQIQGRMSQTGIPGVSRQAAGVELMTADHMTFIPSSAPFHLIIGTRLRIRCSRFALIPRSSDGSSTAPRRPLGISHLRASSGASSRRPRHCPHVRLGFPQRRRRPHLLDRDLLPPEVVVLVDPGAGPTCRRRLRSPPTGQPV